VEINSFDETSLLNSPLPLQSMVNSQESPTIATKSPRPFRTPKRLQDILEQHKVQNSGTTKTCMTIDEMREIATTKRRNRQDMQAEKMKRLRGEVTDVAGIGDIVIVKVDHRDVSHPRGVQGIVFKESNRGAGGCRVVSEVGILTTGNGNQVYYIPKSKYNILRRVVISNKLSKIREQVIDGTFDENSVKHVTVTKAHEMLYKKEIAIRPCKCTHGCKGRCGCMKNGNACTIRCGCNARCHNGEQRIG
jgi:hypothetical protein